MKFKGKKLEEITKGSLDYQRMEILNAFRLAFPEPGDYWYSVEEAFSDHLIVRCYGSGFPNPLMPDEFYRVDFTQSGDTFTFTPQPWPVVELTYQPATAISESRQARKLKRRLVESNHEAITLDEAQENDNPEGPWRLHGIGITADVVNANGRRYPARVLEAAVRDLKGHLNESAGQGRLLSLAPGESDHPKDKGNRRPLLSETVINWDKVDFDGHQVLLEGNLLGTAKGRDIRAQMKGGVKPGISQRANGDTKKLKVGPETIEEVTDLVITGYDLTAPNEASDPEAEVTLFESKITEDEMDLLEELKKLRAEHPELFQGVTDEQLKTMSESQLKKLEGQIREALGIDANANIVESLKKARADQLELNESKRKATIEKVITEMTKDLPYGKSNAAFVEAVRSANPQDEAAVKSLVEAKRKEYDGIFAAHKLAGMGFRSGQISGVAPVLESETGTPEFARKSFELVESIRRVELLPARDWKKAQTPGELFTMQLLERFDKLFKLNLIAEARMLEEAETTADLNLPYTVSRAIIEEAFPNLVASGLFDVGVMNGSPERLYFEHFVGETGYAGTSTAEVTTADLGEWVKLTYGRATPGTFVLTNSAVNHTYEEGVDYVVDYATGRYKALATITDGQSLKATYDYTAMRNGEMQPIPRAKITLDFMVIEAAADRLADLISREAIVFSQSQLGLDIVARVLANLIKQQRRKVDQGLLYMALAQVKSVPGNQAGIWTPGTEQTDYTELVRLIGKAKVKVSNRFYTPTYILCSDTNADVLSNWDGFTRLGFPDAVLNSAGFAGSVKGLPIFSSSEFPDTEIIIGNRELVMYRVLQPLQVKGPYPTYSDDGHLIAADQYYTEQFDSTESPIAEKGSYISIAEEGS